MANPLLPKREAVVQHLRADGEWMTSVDVDPIMLPVDKDGYVDVFDDDLIGLVDGIVTWESLDQSAHYRLVWSDSEKAVVGICPRCDRDFPVSEGFPGDELNEGYNSVCCRC